MKLHVCYIFLLWNLIWEKHVPLPIWHIVCFSTWLGKVHADRRLQDCMLTHVYMRACESRAHVCMRGRVRDRESYVVWQWMSFCIAVIMHVSCFEPHTCIMEGFGTLEMHSLLLWHFLLPGVAGCHESCDEDGCAWSSPKGNSSRNSGLWKTQGACLGVSSFVLFVCLLDKWSDSDKLREMYKWYFLYLPGLWGGR